MHDQVAQLAWWACTASALSDRALVESIVGELTRLYPRGAALVIAAVAWADMITDVEGTLARTRCSGGSWTGSDGQLVASGDYPDPVSEVVATVLCAVANQDSRGAGELLLRTDNLTSYLACRFLLAEAGSALAATNRDDPEASSS